MDKYKINFYLKNVKIYKDNSYNLLEKKEIKYVILENV